MPTATPPAPAASRDTRRLEYDEFIEQQIRRTRTTVKLVDFVSRVMTALAGLLAILLVAALVEHWIVPWGLSVFWRSVLWVGLVAAGAWFVWRQIAPLILQRINAVYAAQAIESHSPGLKNSLLNLLLLRQHRDLVPEAVYRTVEEQAATRLATADVDAAVDRSGLIKIGYVLLAIVVLAGIYKVVSPKDPVATAGRVLMPWADIPVPTRVAIREVEPGPIRVARGESVEVTAVIAGLDEGDSVAVRYSTEDGQTVHFPVEMHRREGEYRFRAELPATPPAGAAPGVQQPMTYYVEAGDARSKEFAITVVDAPTIVLEQIEYDFPDYTRRPDRVQPSNGEIRALEGTRVVLRAQTNHPVKRAGIDLGADGQTDHPLTTLDDDNRRVAGDFVLELDSQTRTQPHDLYALRFTDTTGQRNRNPVHYRLEIIPDLPPEVQILQPSEMEREVRLGQTVAIEIEARDPDYALSRVTLFARTADGQSVEQPLLEQEHEGRLIARHPFTPKGPEFAAGDIVEYWVVVEDNRTPEPNRGVSEHRRLKIIEPPPVEDHPALADQGQGGQEPPQDQQQPGQQPQQGQQQEGQQPQQGRQNQQGQDQQGRGDQRQQQQPGQQAQPQPGQEGQPGQEQQQQPGDRGQDGQPQAGQEQQQQPGQQDGAPQQQQQQQDGSDQLQQRQGQQNGQNGGQGQPQPGGEGTAGQAPNVGGQDGNPAGGQSGGGDQPTADGQRPQGGQSGQRSGQGGQDSPARDQAPPPVPADGSDDGTAMQRIREHLQNQQQQEGQEGQQPQDAAGQPADGRQQEAPHESAADGQRQQQSPQEAGQPQQDGTRNAPADQQRQQQRPTGEQGQAPPEQQPGAQEQQGAQREQAADGQGNPSQAADGQQRADPSAEDQEQAGQSAEPEPPQHGNGADGEAGTNATEQPNPLQEQQGEPGQASRPNNTQGPSGGGNPSPQQGGSPDPSQDQKPTQKTQQQGSDEEQQGGEESQSSRSRRESDSRGEEGGDRSGGGTTGGGQDAQREGTGSAGQNQSADEGDGTSTEKGQGKPSTGEGADQEAGRRTGQAGDEAGRGSEERSGEGTQPGGDQGERPDPQQRQPSNDAANDRQQGQQPDGDDPGQQGRQGDPQQAQRPEDGRQPQQRQGGSITGNPQTGGGDPGNALPPPPQRGNAGPVGDEADLDYARKQTDLILDRLENQLEDRKVDPELLDKLGWSQDDMRKFVERWKNLKQAAQSNGSDADKARRELDQALRSLGFGRQQISRGSGDVPTDELRNLRNAPQIPVPAEFQDAAEAYSSGISQE